MSRYNEYSTTPICNLPGIFAPYVICLTRNYRNTKTDKFDKHHLHTALSWNYDGGNHSDILSALSDIAQGTPEKETLALISKATNMSIGHLLVHIIATLEKYNFPWEPLNRKQATIQFIL